MKPEIGILKGDLKKSISMLSATLADEMILYIKTRKFHWNVAGESFMEMQKLFQDQCTALNVTIEAIAERINKLGGHTIGTIDEFSKFTRLKEFPGKYPTQKQMVLELLSDHESMTRQLREDILECTEINHDAGTTDFLNGIGAQHETIAWILRRYSASSN